MLPASYMGGSQLNVFVVLFPTPKVLNILLKLYVTMILVVGSEIKAGPRFPIPLIFILLLPGLPFSDFHVRKKKKEAGKERFPLTHAKNQGITVRPRQKLKQSCKNLFECFSFYKSNLSRFWESVGIQKK